MRLVNQPLSPKALSAFAEVASISRCNENIRVPLASRRHRPTRRPLVAFGEQVGTMDSRLAMSNVA